MLTYYLIARKNTEELTWPLDVNTIGSYTSVTIGAHYQTDEDGLYYLRSVARQEHNIQVGYTSYIINSNGYPVWKMEVTITETYY